MGVVTVANLDDEPLAIYIGERYSSSMVTKSAPHDMLGPRNPGVMFLILSSLADGDKHGYALTKDIEHFAGVRVAPGTLYEALARLEGQGLIEALPTEERRRPYRLSAAGAAALESHVREQERLVKESRARLRRHWGVA